MGRREAGQRAARREEGGGGGGGRAGAGGRGIPPSRALPPLPPSPPPPLTPPPPPRPKLRTIARRLLYLFCVQPGAENDDSLPQLGALSSAPGSSHLKGLLGDPQKPISGYSWSLSKGQAGRGRSQVRTWLASPETVEPAEELSGGAASAQEQISLRMPCLPPPSRGGPNEGHLQPSAVQSWGHLPGPSVLILEAGEELSPGTRQSPQPATTLPTAGQGRGKSCVQGRVSQGK